MCFVVDPQQLGVVIDLHYGMGPYNQVNFQGYGSSFETVTSWHDHVKVWP